MTGRIDKDLIDLLAKVGFDLEWTGGGCDAFIKYDKFGRTFMITLWDTKYNSPDSQAPSSLTQSSCVGLYANEDTMLNGECEYWINDKTCAELVEELVSLFPTSFS